ncbi:MAG TPA: thioesterase family protein, partial [Myxococcaceae bacterium]|nr:thioesterase family protein [Myxococcaceae bacterium]
KGRTRSTPWCWARRSPASTHSPDAMAYVQRITVRFNEVDYARIVYYPRLFSYCHWVFEDFFGRELGIPYAEVLTKRRVGFPVVSAKADFRSPLRFGDICRVEMEAAQIGRKSLTTRYRLYQGESDLLCAVVEVVAACIDMDSFRATELPDYVRQAFVKLLATSPSGGTQ